MTIDNDNFIDQLYMKNEDALMYVIDEYGGLIKTVIKKNMSCLKLKQEECLNDVLLSIWEHIDSFQPDNNSFQNWIAAIAKYKSIDYMRKYKYESDKMVYDDIENYELQSEDRVEILDNEISARMEELLSVLKPRDREILIRIYANEEPVEQVSQDLNIEKSVIYNRVSRAKKKLRNKKECNYGKYL